MQSLVSFTLPDNVEALSMKAIGLWGYGNSDDNIITALSDSTRAVSTYGNALFRDGGNDTLNGGNHVDFLYGGTSDDTLYGNLASDVLEGGDGNDMLVGGAGNDVFDGGDDADRYVGGAGNDTFVYDAADVAVNQASVYQGRQSLEFRSRPNANHDGDKLLFNSSGETLFLTSLADDRITSIEVIDLTGTGGNTVTLNVSDVLAISNTRELRIDGDGDDLISASGGWAFRDNTTIGGNLYTHYTAGVSHLYIDTDITQFVRAC